MHVGDLDAAGVVSGSRWNATVTIRVHDANGNPLANVTVYGKWTNGTSGSSSCVTNASGYCTVTKTRLSPLRLSVAFNVTNLTRSSFTYLSSANHDPDGDSNGTSILISY